MALPLTETDKFLLLSAVGAVESRDRIAALLDLAGTGNMTGPASATDNAVPRFDGTTGALVQNSGVLIDDSNNITANRYLTGNGTILLPSFASTTSPATGIYFPATNTLAYTTNGTQLSSINTSGQDFIGSSSTKFRIMEGLLDSSGLEFFRSSGTGRINNGGNFSLVIGANSVSAMTIVPAGHVGINTSTPNLGNVGGKWLTIVGTAPEAGAWFEFATPTATTISGQDIGGINAFNGTVHAGEANVQNTSGGSSANYAWRFRSATGTTHLFEMFRCGGPGGTTSAYAQTGAGGAAGLLGVNNVGFDVTGQNNTVDPSGETLNGATFSSTATGFMAAYRSKIFTQTASFTTASMRHFYQDNASLGTGHTVTREITFFAGGKATGGSVGQYAAISDNQAFSGDYFINSTSTNPSLFSGVITPAAGIKGTTTNDSATAGNVGEILTISNTTNNSLTNGNVFSLGSVSITAGDWDVWAVASFSGTGSTSTFTIGGIGTSNSTLGTNGDGTKTQINQNLASQDSNFTVGPFPLSLASPTTYFFNIRADFSGGTVTGKGVLYARRRR